MRVLEHLEIIGNPGLFFAVAAPLVLLVLVAILKLPNSARMAVGLFGLTIAQGFGQFQDFGLVATLGKFIAYPAFGLIIISAFLMRENKSFNPIAFILVAGAIWSILCVFRVGDSQTAIPIRFLWLLLVLAGTSLAAVADSPNKASTCLNYIFWGMAITTFIALTSVVTGASLGGSMRSGRLYPYGANPNQIATLFAFTFVYGFYRSVTAKSWPLIVITAFFTCCGGIGILLTVSRSAILLAFIPSLPILMKTSRRPLFLVFLATIFTAGALALIPTLERHSFDHISQNKGHERRTDHWKEGIDEFLERPYVGLLGETNTNAIERDFNPHNAYVSILCLGGISLAIPYTITFLSGFAAAITVGLRAQLEHDERLFISVMVLLYVCQLLHGFVNEILFYSTFTWAFLAVYLCFFFMNYYLKSPLLQSASHPPYPTQNQFSVHNQ